MMAACRAMRSSSRFPLENVAVKTLPYIDQPYHPQPRGAIAADVVVGDQRVRVVSVHLDVRTSITDRIRQLDPALIDLDERGDRRRLQHGAVAVGRGARAADQHARR